MFLRWPLFIKVRNQQSHAYAVKTSAIRLESGSHSRNVGQKGNSIGYDWLDQWPIALFVLALIQEQIVMAAQSSSSEEGVRSFGKLFLLPTHHHHVGQKDP